MGDGVALKTDDTAYSSTINSEGTFEIRFTLDSATYLNFAHGQEVTAMYVKPGDRISLSIDPKQFDETITYEGSPESSFLAEKYLIREGFDFYGENYYMKSAEDYKSYVDDYLMQLSELLDNIDDSVFVSNEKADAERFTQMYVTRQAKLPDVEKPIRMYWWKSFELNNKYNVYAAIDTLNLEEFQALLNAYDEECYALLENVTDEDFIIKETAQIQKRHQRYEDMKVATDKLPVNGDPAIDFTYPDKNGNEHSLSSLQGSLVYVDVWATWCGPCMAELPDLQKLEAEYHDKNITFLSVSVDTDKAAWLKMLEEKEMGGIQLWADGWSEITKEYAIFGIPRFMLFAADGTVISANAPRPSSAEIRPLLDENL